MPVPSTPRLLLPQPGIVETARRATAVPSAAVEPVRAAVVVPRTILPVLRIRIVADTKAVIKVLVPNGF